MPTPSLPYPEFVKLIKARAREDGFELTPAAIADLAAEAGYQTAGATGPITGPQQRATFPTASQYEQRPPSGIERNLPEGLEALGAMTGAAIGGGATAPAGAAGAAPMAMLGAAIGRMAGRVGQGFLRGQRHGLSLSESLMPLPGSTGEALSGLQQAGKEATGAALFETIPIGMAVAPGLARKVFYRGVGATTPRAVQRAEQALMAEIPLGITDISDYNWVGAFPRTFGTFPIIGTPMRRHAADQAKAITKGLRRQPRLAATLLDEQTARALLHDERFWVRYAPIVGMSRASRLNYNAAGGAFRVFKDQTNKNYRAAYELARQANARVPTARTKNLAHQILQELVDQQPPKVTPKGTTVKRRPSGLFAQARRFANDYTELVDELSIEQWDTMAKDIDAMMSQAKVNGRNEELRYLAMMKAAMEDDFADLIAPREVLDAFNRADAFHHEGKRIFESATAKKLGRIDKRAFKTGYEEAGTMVPDQLHRAVFDDGSADAIRELRELVIRDPNRGRAAWRQMVASDLDSKIQKAIRTTAPIDPQNNPVEVVNYANLRKVLGLTSTKSPEYQALTEALKGTGVKPRDIETFLQSAERAFPHGLPDVAQFARRRANIAGVKGAVRTVAPFLRSSRGGAAGAGAAHAFASPITAAMMALAIRHLGKVLTHPRALRSAIELSKPGLSQAQRVAAARRLQIAIPTVFAVKEGSTQAGTAAADKAAPYLGQARRGARYIYNPWGAILQE